MFAAGQNASRIPAALLRSWRRARAEGAPIEGDPAASAFVSDYELVERRSQHDELRARSLESLDELQAHLSRAGYLALLTDPNGVILDQRGGGDFLDRSGLVHLVAGARWTEGLRGTNAIGTALAEKDCVTVVGRAHLHSANHELVCYAQPILSPDGLVAGLIDLSSNVEAATPLALGALRQTVRNIEEDWRLEAYSSIRLGGLRAIVEMLERLEEPAALIEVSGRVRACSHQLGAGRPKTCRELTGWTWDELHQEEPRMASAKSRFGSGKRLRVERLVTESGRHVASIVIATSTSRPPSPTPPTATRVDPFERILSPDPVVRQNLDRARLFARTNLAVLIVADTGTGKELLARAIHDASPRREATFVPVNCGAISGTLLQSELFGHASGAFTGARKEGYEGLVGRANGGTLFLDEVAELSPAAQAALLRFLEDGTYYRVGEARERHANVRVLSATCRNLEELVVEGTFREDLYYRLKGARLTLPALRERNDIDDLVRCMVEKLCSEQGRLARPRVSAGAMDAIQSYPWPGNLREMRQALHVAVALSAFDATIERHHLPPEVASYGSGGRASSIDRVEEVIRLAGGNISEAARRLGVARSTLYRRRKREGE